MAALTYTPFDHPYLSGLLGDEEIAGLFSVEADIGAMLAFEVALARVEAGLGLIPSEAAMTIGATCAAFTPDMARLRDATARDGVVIPELVRQLRQAVDAETGSYVHFGATSQDVIDTSLILRLKPACTIFLNRLTDLLAAFDIVSERFGSASFTGCTRMQPAIPIAVSDRLNSWRAPLARSLERLRGFVEHGLVLQFGGAAGTLDKLGDKAEAVRCALAQELGLADAPQWQSQRDRLAELAGILSLIAGSLGKFGQDIALLAQAGTEIVLEGGGTSSVMAHKQNPVAAETLVALARFNAVQLSGMHQALVHEQERSGAAWMLEWMLLPTMVAATGTALLLARRITGSIRSLGQ